MCKKSVAFEVNELKLKKCPDCDGRVDFSWSHAISRSGRVYEKVWAECSVCGRVSRKTVVDRFTMSNKTYIKIMRSWNKEKKERRKR